MKYLIYSILIIFSVHFSSCTKNESLPIPIPTCNNQLLYGKYKSTSNGDTIIIRDDIQNLNNKDGWCAISDSIFINSYKSKYEYCVNSNSTMSIRYTGPCKIYFLKIDILPYTFSNGILTFGTPTTNNQVYSLKNIANTSFVKL